MRIRTVKPEFWSSEDVAKLSWESRLTFIGLWNYVDDNGVGRAAAALIVAALYPLDDPHEARNVVELALAEMSSAGLIRFFSAEGRNYLTITGWAKHQYIARPRRSKLPSETASDQPILTIEANDMQEHANDMQEHANDCVGTREQGNKGTREQGNGGRRAKARTLLPDDFCMTPELRQWAEVKAPAVNLAIATERFVLYYRSVGGDKSLKSDWPTTWKNWILKDQAEAQRNGWQARESGKREVIR